MGMNNKNVALLFATTRPKFLLLTPICSLLAMAVVYQSSKNFHGGYSALIIAGAILATISVNTFNEYFDFRSGLDLLTIKTPFSGGSGALPQKPELAKATLNIGILSCILTAAIGLILALQVGWQLIPVGMVGLLLVVSYTPYITRSPYLCLIAPGLAMGPLTLMGTGFVLSGAFSMQVFIASLVPFFLINNLLLLNQFPDIEADRKVGRCHLPIMLGKRRSGMIFIVNLVLAYSCLVFGVIGGYLPTGVLLGLLTVIIAIPMVFGILKNQQDLDRLKPYMHLNVLVNLLTPVLMFVGLLWL